LSPGDATDTFSLDEDTADGSAYHGYWPQNIYALNSRFGSIRDLQALSSAIHARNMYLMLDVVANHYGWAGNSSAVDYSRLIPFNDAKYFHSYCPITSEDYSSSQSVIEQVSTPSGHYIVRS